MDRSADSPPLFDSEDLSRAYEVESRLGAGAFASSTRFATGPRAGGTPSSACAGGVVRAAQPPERAGRVRSSSEASPPGGIRVPASGGGRCGPLRRVHGGRIARPPDRPRGAGSAPQHSRRRHPDGLGAGGRPLPGYRHQDFKLPNVLMTAAGEVRVATSASRMARVLGAPSMERDAGDAGASSHAAPVVLVP